MYEYNDKFCGSSANESEISLIIDEIINKKLSTDEYKVLQGIDQNFEHLEECAKSIISNFDSVVIIGMGGAVLNPKTILGLNLGKKEKIGTPKVMCLDTTDIQQILSIQNQVDLRKTKFIVISKSGNTMETISAFAVFFNLYQNLGIADINEHFLFITKPNDGHLKTVAIENNIQTLDHEEISGRFPHSLILAYCLV